MKMYWQSSQLLLGVISVTMIACSHRPAQTPAASPTAVSRVANLHAFARLYGVVRWFHPSDAAAAIDWDRFAIEGARSVIDVPAGDALRVRLTELFAPVAPTMHIVAAGERFPVQPATVAGAESDLDLIAWQHKGYGDSTAATGYASKRRHRDRTVAVPGASSAALSQSVDAVPYRGTRIRLRGKLRTANHAQGRLWLRVDGAKGRRFLDSMARNPIVSEAWAEGEIIGIVDADATKIVFGVLKSDVGTTWYDDLELSVEAKDHIWAPIAIRDADFEAPDSPGSWQPGIGREMDSRVIDGWTVTIDHDRPASGSSSLRIEPTTKVMTEELFDEMPAPGETVDVDLGNGLIARVPIALYSMNGRTIGDDPEVARHAQAASPGISSTRFDPINGVADVIVFWNVFEHFWPYWDVVSIDWKAELDRALVDSLDDHDVDEHIATLERLSAAVPDGHIDIGCPGESEHGYLPFAVDLVENQVVITSSADHAIERGDVLVSIGGQTALDSLSWEEMFVSGSAQWKAVRGLRRLGRGRIGSSLPLRLQRSGGELGVTVTRKAQSVIEEKLHSAIERFDDEVYYVDLSRASATSIDAAMDQLARAPGVVFDLRGRPKDNHGTLSHVFVHQDDLRSWVAIPLVIRPDSAASPAAWEDTSRDMLHLSVLQPHIRGRVAFLTGPRAISYPETIMALVEYYHLGEIVGAATAGTNGEVAQITLPTGCDTYFTGRRVTKPDGSRQHLIGVKPTIPASRTIAGVRAGRDEVLEKALAYVRSGSK
jgi:hypothetical protein